MRRLVIVTLISVIAASSVASGQPAPAAPLTPAAADRRSAIIDDFVLTAREAHKAAVARPFLVANDRGGINLIAAYLMAVKAKRPAYGALLTALEAVRPDKQVGAAPGSSGGTSLAMKGLAPRIFGVAVEQGALTREVSGTTLTFRANPVGLVKALAGAGLFELHDDYAVARAQRLASRFSLAASFDVSRGSSPGVFTGSDQQFSSWSARYALVDRRDPASPAYADEWARLLSPDTATYRQSVETLSDALNRSAGFTAWRQALLDDIARDVEAPFTTSRDFEASEEAYRRVLTASLTQLEAVPLSSEIAAALDTYVAELMALQSSIDAIYRLAARGPLLTLDVTASRDETLPGLYTATGIFEAGLGASRRTDLTINAAVSAYTRRPAGVGHALTSIDVTTQVDRPLGRALLTPTLTIAARYAYLPHDTVASTGAAAGAPAAVVGAAPRGHIGLLQAKVTIPLRNSGVKVPISVTASNRTALIEERDVRGSIGITLDLDTLMSVLGGGR